MMYAKAFEQVFGKVNTGATTRDGKTEMRKGKTARDKANGHQAGVKNRRIWDDGGRAGSGKWVKV